MRGRFVCEIFGGQAYWYIMEAGCRRWFPGVVGHWVCDMDGMSEMWAIVDNVIGVMGWSAGAEAIIGPCALAVGVLLLAPALLHRRELHDVPWYQKYYAGAFLILWGIVWSAFCIPGQLGRRDMTKELVRAYEQERCSISEESGALGWRDCVWISCLAGCGVLVYVRKVILMRYGHCYRYSLFLGYDRRLLAEVARGELRRRRRLWLRAINTLVPALFVCGMIGMLLR